MPPCSPRLCAQLKVWDDGREYLGGTYVRTDKRRTHGAHRRTREKERGAQKRRAGISRGGKGGVSVYGLGRFPVTLYYEQWIRLLDASKDLREFLEENKHRLKLKDQ